MGIDQIVAPWELSCGGGSRDGDVPLKTGVICHRKVVNFPENHVVAALEALCCGISCGLCSEIMISIEQ